MEATLDKLSVISPARYRITVLGFLDESISDRLGEMAIEYEEPDQKSGNSVVTLTGWLADQAALFGVLKTLYNMRRPLISVEYLGAQD